MHGQCMASEHRAKFVIRSWVACVMAVYRLLVCLQGGCIIRAGFLDDIKNAYKRNPDLENLVLDDWFANKLAERQDAWRDVVKIAITNGGSCLHAVLPCSCQIAAAFELCCIPVCSRFPL